MGKEGESGDEEDEDAESDDEGEDDDEEEGEEEGEADEEDVASESDGGDEEEKGDNEELVKHSTKPPRKHKARSSKKKELPFTFPCPATHDEFLEIIEDVDDADIPTVVKRIRTLYHPSLADDNKYKLQVI